jgi:dienelactone hydrolase
MWILHRAIDSAAAAYSARRRLFTDGVGDRDAYDWARSDVDSDVPRLEPEWRGTTNGIRSGTFTSPVAERLPPEARTARVELLLPDGAAAGTPVSLLLAATGEVGFARRRHFFARPLLQRGIGTLSLENPFYGARRPAGQQRTAVRTVSGLGVMARTALEEARGLLQWLRRQGFVPGVAGVSMGGQIAAMAAATVPFPVAVAPCIPSRTPAPVFLDGELRRMVDWIALERTLGTGFRDAFRRLLADADVCRLPVPVRPDAAIIVAAAEDAILPLQAALDIHRHWPGSELRLVPAGHISALLLHAAAFRRAIADSFRRLAGPAS